MAKICAIESPVLEMGRIMKNRLSALRVNPYRTELVFQITSHFQHWRHYCIYFKIPPVLVVQAKGRPKKQQLFFSHFHGLVSDINYKDLEGSVMLGTISEPRRGETSHIWDISVLKVNNKFGLKNFSGLL